MQTNPPEFVFDFDGVIVDSGQAVYDTVQQELERLDISPLRSMEEFLELFDARDPLKSLARRRNNSNKGALLTSSLLERFVQIYPSLPLIPGAAETFRSLSETNTLVHILTANSEAVVRNYLNIHNINQQKIIIAGLERKEPKSSYLIRVQQRASEDRPAAFVADTWGDHLSARDAKGLLRIAYTGPGAYHPWEKKLLHLDPYIHITHLSQLKDKLPVFF